MGLSLCGRQILRAIAPCLLLSGGRGSRQAGRVRPNVDGRCYSASATGVRLFGKVCAVIVIVALAAANTQAQTSAPAGSAAMSGASLQDDPVGESPMSIDWTPQIWQQHVASERWRVRRGALLRSPRSSAPVWPTVEEQARRASEQALSDLTLERGDIIVTTKGLLRFKGRSFEPRLPDDFEAVSSSGFTRPDHTDK
jgi:hypothetical protein